MLCQRHQETGCAARRNRKDDFCGKYNMFELHLNELRYEKKT